jgi:hypothetical protein
MNSGAPKGPGQVTLIVVYDRDSVAGRCDAGCYDAADQGCCCICGGANHGAGKRRAIRNTRKHADQWLDRAIEANPSILAASIMPDADALARME